MNRRILVPFAAISLCAAGVFTVVSPSAAIAAPTAPGVMAAAPGPCTTTPPAAPSSLRPLALSPTTVTLRWTIVVPDPGCSPTGFDILRASATGGPFTRLAQTGYTDTFADTTVAPATTYRYQVLARSAYGLVSGPSNTVQLTTPGNCTPPLPMGSLTVRAVTATSVSLSWVGPTNPACFGYDILRAPTTSDATFSVVGTTTGLSFTNTGLPPGTTFRYVVRGRILPTGNPWGVTNVAIATTIAY